MRKNKYLKKNRAMKSFYQFCEDLQDMQAKRAAMKAKQKENIANAVQKAKDKAAAEDERFADKMQAERDRKQREKEDEMLKKQTEKDLKKQYGIED